MATGNPNQDKLVHFIAKVRDTDGEFKPIYTPLDATDRVYGNVLLSDEIDYPASEEDKNCAATGVRAATPKAVKSVATLANNKLDKYTPFPQSVQSEVEFKNSLTLDKGAVVPKGEYITGDLKGNAATSDKFKKAVNLSTKSGTLNPSGSILFDGSQDVTIPLGELDATKLKGLVPLDSIPQGALERVYSADSIDDAIQKYNDAPTNEKPFQEGDTVRITGVTPPIMYVVVGNPSVKKSYIEYAAGTATRAYEADQALKLTTDTGSDTKPVYFKDGIPVELKGNIGAAVKPIYVKDGELTALSDTIGNTNKPVYMQDGSITALDYEINKSVPADAKFTDTTYDVFEADVDGLVPAPTADEAANNKLFLKSDGTWGELIGGSVTGVKGDTEHKYRTKDVNLTYENIGAVGLYDPSYNWKPSDVEDYEFDSTYFWGGDTNNNFFGVKIKTSTPAQPSKFNFFYPASYKYLDEAGMKITAPMGTILPYHWTDSAISSEKEVYITFQLKSNVHFSFDVLNSKGNEAVDLININESLSLNTQYLRIKQVRYDEIAFPDENDHTTLDVTVAIIFAADVQISGSMTYNLVLEMSESAFQDLISISFGKFIRIELPAIKPFVYNDVVSEEAHEWGDIRPIVAPVKRQTSLYGCSENGYDYYSDGLAGDHTTIRYDLYPSIPYPLLSNIENSPITVESFFALGDSFANILEEWNANYLNQSTNEDKINFLKSMIPGFVFWNIFFNVWTNETGKDTRLTIINDSGIGSITSTPRWEIILEKDGIFGVSFDLKHQIFGTGNILSTHLKSNSFNVQFCFYIDFLQEDDPDYLKKTYAAHATPQPFFPDFTSSETKPTSKQSMKALSPNVEDKIYTTEGGLMPGAITTNLGSIDEPFNEIYANIFDGELIGNATTATTANRLNSSLTLNGNVSGTVNFNSDGNHTMTTTLANDTITLAKLASDVGTIAVQSTQPTDSNVKLWIKI